MKTHLTVAVLLLCLLINCCLALEIQGEHSRYADDLRVRLVSDNHEYGDDAGLVEVFINGAWGGICDNNAGDLEADAICRSMGYMKASVIYNDAATDRFNTWPTDVFLKNLNCQNCYHSFVDEPGHCYALSDCSYDSLLDVSCSRDSLLGVECYEEEYEGFDIFSLMGPPLYGVLIAAALFCGGIRLLQRHQRMRLAERRAREGLQNTDVAYDGVAAPYPDGVAPYPGAGQYSNPVQSGFYPRHDNPGNVSTLTSSYPTAAAGSSYPTQMQQPGVGSYPTQMQQQQQPGPIDASTGHTSTPHDTHGQTMPTSFVAPENEDHKPWSIDSHPPPPPYTAVTQGTAENVDDMPPPPSYDDCV